MYIEVKETKGGDINIKEVLMQQGAEMMLNVGIFIGVVLIGVIGSGIKRKLERVLSGESKEHPKIKDEDIERINNILYGVLHEYEATRVFILEFHNGQISASGYGFNKVSMTYEVVQVGIARVARYIQNIPKSIMIEDLIRAKKEGVGQITEDSSTNPLLAYGDEIVFLIAIDRHNLEKGCIGVSFRRKGYKVIEIEELEKAKNKLKQIMG